MTTERVDRVVFPRRKDAVLHRIMLYLRHNHVALLALFIALGGTSYAAIKLPANSVGSKQLKNKAVTRAKLSPAAVSALKGAKGDTGATGTTGATGAPGAKGDPGPRGDVGTPGPTASAALSQATSASLNGTDKEVMHVDITTSWNSTLVANATADVVRDAGASVNVHCILQMAPGPAFTAYTTVGPQALSYEAGTSVYETTLPLVGATSQPAGTYRFRTLCGMGGATGSFINGGMTVIATAA